MSDFNKINTDKNDPDKNDPDKNNSNKQDPNTIAGRVRDGEVTVTVSDDELTAYVDFFPPLGGGNPIAPDRMENILEAEGISYGIEWEKLRESLFQCNTDRKPVKGVVIARGKKPKKAVPDYIQLKERLFRQKPLVDSASPRVDFKEITPYIIVKKDEVLGKENEAQPGEAGVSVKNEKIQPGRRDVVLFTLGDNVGKKEDGTIVATVEGRFEKKGNTISVGEVLNVEGGVDYHTGHIIFPGDVVINGEVKDGFKVYSGGTVICKDSLDVFDVVGKKDLVVSSGIIGKNKGMVRVGGDITAKFIDNCYVKAKGSLYIQDEILNSRVYTLGRIEMSERGKIIGGEIWAVQGIAAYQVGNEAGQSPSLQCGIDFIAQKKLDQIKKKHTSLYLKLQTIEDLLKKEKKKQLLDLESKVKKGMMKLEKSMNRLLEKIHSNEDAEIVVHDTVFPGTTIDICNFHYIVDDPMRHVRFRLNKEQGKIVSEKLK